MFADWSNQLGGLKTFRCSAFTMSSNSHYCCARLFAASLTSYAQLA